MNHIVIMQFFGIVAARTKGFTHESFMHENENLMLENKFPCIKMKFLFIKT